MSKSEGEHPPELMRMRQRLDEFRRGTRPGVAFPGWVWAAAARLAQRHGVHRTGRALGLEYNKLKRASGGAVTAVRAAGSRRRTAGRTTAVKFVELTGALPLAGACRLQLAGPAGQRLELEMPPGAATEVVLGLCRAGWGHGG
jgi:hypothetical protein